MSLKEAISILKETFSEWMEDQAPTLGAALAYYTVFSLAPVLIIAISIAGLVFGKEAAQGQIFDQLRGLLGDESGRAMQVMVQNASAEPATGLAAALVGFSPSRGEGSSVSFRIAFSRSALSWWSDFCSWFLFCSRPPSHSLAIDLVTWCREWWPSHKSSIRSSHWL
jgi:hypothetical protein